MSTEAERRRRNAVAWATSDRADFRNGERVRREPETRLAKFVEPETEPEPDENATVTLTWTGKIKKWLDSVEES